MDAQPSKTELQSDTVEITLHLPCVFWDEVKQKATTVHVDPQEHSPEETVILILTNFLGLRQPPMAIHRKFPALFE